MSTQQIMEAILDQREERERIIRGDRVIEREALGHWAGFVDTELVKVATGVRRSGKTVFAHLLLKDRNTAFVNFDDERLGFLGKEDLNDVLKALYEIYGDFDHLLLDEIQNIDGWELFVNRLQRKGMNILVTGSNARLLSREFSTYLTGRHIRMEIYPFSFGEFLMYKGLKFDVLDSRSTALIKRALRDYMETGGFPEVVKNPEMRNTYLSSLYSSIISRDIVGRHRVRFTRTFRELSLTVLSNFSRMVSYNKLKNTHGLKSVHTAKNYMDHLEEAYLIFTLEKYSPKVKEVVNSPKKVYAIDTGLIKSLAISPSEDTGLLMENIVFLELMRRRAVSEGTELYYYRDTAGREVDFLIRQGKNVRELIQVTYAFEREDIARREINALIKASGATECKKMKIITWDWEGKIEKEGGTIDAVPLWKWLGKWAV